MGNLISLADDVDASRLVGFEPAKIHIVIALIMQIARTAGKIKCFNLNDINIGYTLLGYVVKSIFKGKNYYDFLVNKKIRKIYEKDFTN